MAWLITEYANKAACNIEVFVSSLHAYLVSVKSLFLEHNASKTKLIVMESQARAELTISRPLKKGHMHRL